MASKQLTATVRLNTKQAERSISNLTKKINKINTTLNRVSGNNQVERQLTNADSRLNGIVNKVRSWSNGQKLVNSGIRTSNTLLGSVGSKLKSIAATYFGLMGTKAVVNMSDTITSAQNKLNYVNAQNLGASGVNADGSYNQATFDATKDSMDKMYGSAQKVRMSYSDLVANVSKSMALAGDSFQDNTDNAIRFQEIMAEAYAVGGASAQEMHSSMYQMIQALGANVLAGDELRSVREGAPLAYKAIEEFAQGVLDSEESLKELASQGLITADMVVAAIMDAGDQMDKAFAQTNQTFAQTWSQVKNAAIQAFRPVMGMLQEMHQRAIDNGLVQKVETLFSNIAKIVMIAFALIRIGIEWVAEKWNQFVNFIQTHSATILKVISTVLLIIAGVIAVILIPKIIAWLSLLPTAIGYYALLGAEALAAGIKAMIGWIAANWVLALIILAIVAVIAAVIWMADSFEDACGMIVGGIMAAISYVWNFFVTFLTAMLKQILLPLFQAWDNFANFFGNLFNDPIAAIIHNFEGLADTVLSILQTIASGIDAIFGSNLSATVQGWRDGLSSKADELAQRWGNGTYEEKSAMADKVDELITSISTDLLWNTSDAYNKGYDWGYSGASWVTDKLSSLKDGLGAMSLDSIGEKLGLDFSDFGNFPGASDLSGAYSVPEDLLSGIKDDTGDIKDSMELTAEDLEYLRKIAEMEWKKEYTTAEIKIDMSNYNTIEGDSDLDGIVTKLTDKLYEELASVANGVYV